MAYTNLSLKKVCLWSVSKIKQFFSSSVMKFFYWTIPLGLVGLLAFCWRCNPIRRDRKLFSGGALYKCAWVGAFVISSVLYVALWSYLLEDAEVSIRAINLLDIDNDKHSFGILWAVICHFMDPGSLPYATGRLSKFFALIAAFLGVVCLSGLVVSTIVNYLTQKEAKWKKGLLQYNMDSHVVIIGSNEQTATIIRQVLKRKEVKYVLVQSRQDIEHVRAKIELRLDKAEEERLVFYSGERTSWEDIKQLQIEKAIEVYVLGEDMHCENEEDHDAYNMSCVEQIGDYMKDHATFKPIKCHVNFEFQSTYTVFKSTHVYRDIDDKHIEFLPFNVHEIWAKKVLVDNYALLYSGAGKLTKVQRYFPLDAYWYEENQCREIKYISSESDKSVHLFVMGMNQMGTAFATQAALLMHLPNFVTKGIRTTITFIDDNAIKEAEFFMGRFNVLFELSRYRIINAAKEESWEESFTDSISEGRFAYMGENFVDVQWEFIQGNVAAPAVMKYIVDSCKNPAETCTIAICFNNPQQSIATAMYLKEDILKHALQILVYQQHSFDMIEKVAHSEKQWKRYDKLKPFGMIENCYKGNVFDNLMAKLFHYKFVAPKEIKDAIANDSVSLTKNLIYDINRTWDELGIVDKLSNIDLADSVALKLRSARTSLASTKASQLHAIVEDELSFGYYSFTEHNRWLVERLMMGFRPLTADEWFKYSAKGSDRKMIKDLYKAKKRAHVDICSNYWLDEKVELEKRHSNDELFLKTMPVLLHLHDGIVIAQCEKDSILYKLLNSLVEVESGSLIVKDAEGKSKELVCGKFYMQRHPFPESMWNSIMIESPIKHGKLSKEMISVSLEDIEDFLVVLQDKYSLHFSLPSKEEWEYAARGGQRSRNYIYSGSNNIHFVARSKNRWSLWSPLRCKNELGLSDMSGNLWEWSCSPNEKSTYCICGGSKDFTDHWCKLDECYSYWSSDFKSSDLGFRLILRCNDFYSFKIIKDSRDHEQYITNLFKGHFTTIPQGEFRMGLSDVFRPKYKGRTIDVDAEQPQHSVRIDSFMMGEVPVTQQMWFAIMGNNPSFHKGDLLPVENVSFKDVQKFLRKLNKKSKLLRYLTENPDFVFRLPTEAEWEYAARGGEPNSDILFSGSANADDVAWHNGLTKSTQKVKQKKANGYGLYDMCGNVLEWCNDWYIKDYYVTCQKEGTVSNPTGPEGPRSSRVFRGGSWKYSAEECRLTKPGYWIEDYAAPDLGFRLVLGRKITNK